MTHLTRQRPRRSVRSAKKTAEALPPVLQFTTISQFVQLYNDSGSGASSDGAFYRPVVPDGWFFFGDYGQRGYTPPNASIVIVQVTSESGAPALAAPIDWAQIWNDHGTGGDNDGSFWAPVPPQGYVSCGHVIQAGYDQPAIGNSQQIELLMCIRADLAKAVPVQALIWSDVGSGGDGDVSVYSVPIINDFVTTPYYDDPPQVYVPLALLSQ